MRNIFYAALILMAPQLVAAQGAVICASGEGASCGGYDNLTKYIINSGDTPQPSLIWGGNTAPECGCVPDYIQFAKPISTISHSSTHATFIRDFTMTVAELGIDCYLTVIADDGAQIYINGALLATIDLDPPGEPVQRPPRWHVIVVPASMFMLGQNELKFYVTNTQIGRFGSPTGRGGSGDCMYVNFALVSYPVPVQATTWGNVKVLYQ